MNQKTKGIIVSVTSSLLYMIVVVVLGAVLSVTDSDPWFGLVFAIFMAIFGIGVILIILIVFAIKYRKTKSEYALGVVYGLSGYLLMIAVSFLINFIFN
jgi:hypothetical protein